MAGVRWGKEARWGRKGRGAEGYVEMLYSEKHNRVSSFCRGSLKMILNNPLLNFGQYTST